MEMREAQIAGLLQLWADLDAAIGDVETALPQQMSARILKLKGGRQQFRSRLLGLMQEEHARITGEAPEAALVGSPIRPRGRRKR
jgi:hypothetical protein